MENFFSNDDQLILTHDTNNQFQTIFYQGIFCSQAQMTKYIGAHDMKTSSGQTMLCSGLHHLKPIDVLINPFIGKEIKDIDTHVFKGLSSYLNPLNILSSCVTKFANWYQGIEVYDQENAAPKNNLKEDLKTYGLNISQISIGQETDIESHYEKYKLWKQAFPNNNLILWGVSRGAAATFNAVAKYKYPEAKLVVLEACFNTFNDVLKNRYLSPFSSLFNLGLNLFTRYHDDGPSPAKSVADFPEHVPVVFITSKKDTLVPASSTTKLANALAQRQKNDVYLLKLEHGSHPNYMFDDKADHDNYEAFIHAIYQKYHMPYDKELALKGAPLLAQAALNLEQKNIEQKSSNSEQHEYTNRALP